MANRSSRKARTETVTKDDVQKLLDIFSLRFSGLLDSKGFLKGHGRYKQVALHFDATPSLARGWCQGKALPNPFFLGKISQLFSVSIEYLLGFEEAHLKVLQIPAYFLNKEHVSSSFINFTRLDFVISIPDVFFDSGTYICLKNWDPEGKSEWLFIKRDINAVLENSRYVLLLPKATYLRTAKSLTNDNFSFFIDRDNGERKEVVLHKHELNFFPHLSEPLERRPGEGNRVSILGLVYASLVLDQEFFVKKI